tara:strand:+ start:1366 stop:1743 length:378 start_codon:yes stop_codon:yes gene_type:complete
MPDLSPKKHVPKLRDNWFVVCSNPEEPNDKSLCIQILQGPFSHVVLKYKDFKTEKGLNDDGTLTCQYSYDIITSPSDIGERIITDEQGKIFEENLGKAILEIIEEYNIVGDNENRNNNTEESVTK